MSSGGESAYGAAGVDYETLDAGKRNALTEALATSPALLAAPGGGHAVDESRGEPAFVFEAGGQTLAFVVEGLGTKSMIARACEDQLGAHGFHAVAYDTVAAIVNDLCCVGAVPLVVNAYFATGASDWYAHADRQAGLLAGWRAACEHAGATWGGGESPALSGLVSADEIELAGSAVGLVPGGSPILGAELTDGDEIVFVDSSGLHANGASLARRIAAQLPEAYRFTLPSGTTFGRALLEPSVIYAPLVRCVARLRRRRPLPQPYHRPRLPQADAPASDVHLRDRRSAVGCPRCSRSWSRRRRCPRPRPTRRSTWAPGFAVYCAAGEGEAVVALAAACGMRAHVAGHVVTGPRRVVLPGLGVTFESDALDLTPRG